MLFLEHNHLERRVRCYKGSSTASTATQSTSQDNKRTVTGDAVNAEIAGNGNVVNLERADAGVLVSAASLLSDISFDNAETTRAGLKLARDLGVNTQDAAVALGGQAFAASNQAVANLQAGQEKTLRTLTDAFNTAKTADAEQVNKLAKNGLIAGGVVTVAALIAIIVSKKK